MPVLTAVATDEEGPVLAPVVVVGAGTAGIAFAVEFVRHSPMPLVIIEPGGHAEGSGSHRFMDAVRPSNLWPGINVQCVDNGPVLPYAQARAIGGGSAVNGMLEGRDGSATPANGQPGLAALLGSAVPDGTVGGALVALNGRAWRRNVIDGRRVDGTSALAEMVESGRVTLIRGEVEHVIIRDGKAVGVMVGGRLVEASRVVMCAGAVGTPTVLNRSDLPGDLRSLIGRTLFDHPSVSFTLHLRRQAPEAAADVEFYVDTADLPWRNHADALQLAREQMIALARQMNIEERVGPGQGWRPGVPDVRLAPGVRSVITGYERASADEPGLALLSGILLTPRSSGWLELDGSPLLRPRMMSHPADQMAMLALVRDMIRVALRPEIMAVATHVTVDRAGTRVTEIAGLPDDLLAEWIRSHLVPLSHAAGTCSGMLGGSARSGRTPTDHPRHLTVSEAQISEVQRRIASRWRETNRAEAVLAGRISDPTGSAPLLDRFSVRGVQGLHVADSSAMEALPDDMVNARVARQAADAARAVANGPELFEMRGRTA
jgi:choline dehydrogenase-like flavoprotein